jgi:hypothetical protein
MEAGVFLKKTALRGNLRDRRFNQILQQGLGNVAESLAKRLLIAEGFVVKDFSFNVSRYIAGVRCAGGRSAGEARELWEELLEEYGPLFADPRVQEFANDLDPIRAGMPSIAINILLSDNNPWICK